MLPYPTSATPLILLIENDAANRLLAELILQRAGYVYRSAADGREALALSENEYFALIVTDISLPDLDGYHLARLIRERPAYAHTPFVAITGYAHAAERQRALEVGFVDVLVKPYRREQLVALVERCLTEAARP